MNKKIFIQIILFLIIILLIGLFFFEVEDKHSAKKNAGLPTVSNEDFSNLIENIEYISSDEIGNKYIIKASHGEILNENKELILMSDVLAKISFNNNENITITSKKAFYNTISYDTEFKGDVFIKYADHSITSENVDMIFKDQKIKIYNKIEYTNLNSTLLADIAEIDLLTNDLKIYMNENKKKINITYNNNAN